MKSALERKNWILDIQEMNWLKGSGGKKKRFNLIDFCVEIMRGHIRQILTEWSVKKKKKITLENLSDEFQDIELFRN